MRRTIDVFIGDVPIRLGSLHYDAQGSRESAAFEYSREWLSAEHAFAIAPSLRLITGPQYHKRSREGSVFHDPIADTEPDGWAKNVIRRDHAKRRQQARRSGEPIANAHLSSLDFLLAVDDVSRVGALRYRNEDGVFCRAHDDGHRTTPPLVELNALVSATRAVELNEETLEDLACLRGRGTSLGGLRPKCSVVDDDGRLSIAKFPSVQDQRAVTKGEVLALQLAKQAGIDAAEARLVSSDGVDVALVARFDRAGTRRVPYASAATLLSVDTTAPGEHAYTEIVDAIRAHGATVQRDIEELFRRIAFSILITNIDDHLLNHGFLHVERGRWRLAPGFDINPFPDRARELKTWISEETGPAASIDALLSVAPYFLLKPKRARSIIRDVEAAVACWRTVGSGLGMTARELEAYDEAFEHDERTAAQKAARTAT
jgi:serine/threonine-protein kinase HipA